MTLDDVRFGILLGLLLASVSWFGVDMIGGIDVVTGMSYVVRFMGES